MSFTDPGGARDLLWQSALGERRGPAPEARLLYEETAPPVHQSELRPAWTPLLLDEECGSSLRRDNRLGNDPPIG